MDSAAKRSSMRSAVYAGRDKAADMGRPIVRLDLFVALNPAATSDDGGTLVVDTAGKTGEPIYYVTTNADGKGETPVPTERFRSIYAARYADLLREANKLPGAEADGSLKAKNDFIGRLKAVALNLKIKERKFTNFEYLEKMGLQKMKDASLAGNLEAYNKAYKNLAKLRKSRAKYGELETLEDKKITIFKDQKVGAYAVQAPIDLPEMKKILSKYGAEDELQIMDYAITETNRLLYTLLDVGGMFFAGQQPSAAEVKVIKDRGLEAKIPDIKRNALAGQPRLYFDERLVDPVTSDSGAVLPKKQVTFNPDPQDDLNALAGEIAVRGGQKKIEAANAQLSLGSSSSSAEPE